MPRTPKRGIDYAPWNTDIFENDTKIDALIDAQGWAGFSIYFYLCQKAYASDGYFYRWSYANAPTTARRMGGGIGSETVKQTVALCLRIGLFDSKLFDRENVLTSKGIQRRFLSAIEKRRVKDIDASLWLLGEDETENVHLLPANSDLQTANADLLPANDTKSKVKKSKGKVKESKVHIPTREEVREYVKSRNSSVDPDKFFDFFDAGEWVDSKGNPVLNWKQKLITWESKSKEKKPQQKQYTTKGSFFDDE